MTSLSHSGGPEFESPRAHSYSRRLTGSQICYISGNYTNLGLADNFTESGCLLNGKPATSFDILSLSSSMLILIFAGIFGADSLLTVTLIFPEFTSSSPTTATYGIQSFPASRIFLPTVSCLLYTSPSPRD